MTRAFEKKIRTFALKINTKSSIHVRLIKKEPSLIRSKVNRDLSMFVDKSTQIPKISFVLSKGRSPVIFDGLPMLLESIDPNHHKELLEWIDASLHVAILNAENISPNGAISIDAKDVRMHINAREKIKGLRETAMKRTINDGMKIDPSFLDVNWF